MSSIAHRLAEEIETCELEAQGWSFGTTPAGLFVAHQHERRVFGRTLDELLRNIRRDTRKHTERTKR